MQTHSKILGQQLGLDELSSSLHQSSQWEEARKPRARELKEKKKWFKIIVVSDLGLGALARGGVWMGALGAGLSGPRSHDELGVAEWQLQVQYIMAW